MSFTTTIRYTTSQIGPRTKTLVMTRVSFGGGATTGGMTQTQGDARYVRLAQVNQANGIAGLDADAFVGEANLPLPPVDLTTLFENKLA